MQRSDFRCVHRLRVRWAEVDMQKIVFNAHYLMYIDNAMSDYWRALALPYEASMLALGGEMYVKKATVEYHASARLDDTLDVGLRCARVGNSSSLFEAGIFSGDQLLVSGELVYVFADPATQTSRPVPPALRAIFEGFEAGADMAEVRTGDWNALGRDAADCVAGVLRCDPLRLRVTHPAHSFGKQQDARDLVIDGGLVDVAGLHRSQQPLCPGVHGTGHGQVHGRIRRCLDAAHGSPVADDHAVETPIAAQRLCQQRALGHRVAVHAVVRSHDRPGAGLDNRCLERGIASRRPGDRAHGARALPPAGGLDLHRRIHGDRGWRFVAGHSRGGRRGSARSGP